MWDCHTNIDNEYRHSPVLLTYEAGTHRLFAAHISGFLLNAPKANEKAR